ncbi:ATP-dependent zinc metalloprotease FtsH [Maricaulis sp. D1M11]|uniref:ATP-dependent zinc metalloprotease FtsH n=1 Tax=Maricaulis sp. D1M11 TaxID=3076117 RepID=UPI0039B6B44B
MQMRNLLIWALIILLLLALVQLFQGPATTTGAAQEITYSDFMDRVGDNSVNRVEIAGNEVIAYDNSGVSYRSRLPDQDDSTISILRENGVDIEVQEETREGSFLLSLLINSFPVLLLIGVWIFFMRQMQGGGRGGAMGFGKSKARLLTEHQGRKTFDDVAGVDEAKEELQEVVEFLKDPSKFQRLGGKIPKGALLVGPPGTGKTLLARAVAGEANVPFFSISGSDFVEMFVGVGASRVRDMFEQAKKNAPCIIFIDEIDAVGRSRGAGHGGGNDEREQTLNQLLVEMDGFEANEGIIILAATNRPDVLDSALRRPGRFDREVVVDNPDVTGREKILKVHMRDVPIAKDVKPRVIARATPGFSGADLANLVNEAALLAARRNKRVVAMAEFNDAKDKVMMGPERRSRVMSDHEKEMTAYHEAGHAIVSLNVPGTDPIHKATIIPRGRALGMVQSLPENDRYSQTREQMTSFIAMAMGGRVAEELKYGKEQVTSGASQDIRMATNIARHMVMHYGLSDELGPISYSDVGDPNANPFSGVAGPSPETAKKIEDEIKSIVVDGEETARQILTDKNKDWVALAEGLLEYETLSGEEIDDLLNGKPPNRDDADEEPPAQPPTSAVPTTDDPDEAGPETGPEPQGA